MAADKAGIWHANETRGAEEWGAGGAWQRVRLDKEEGCGRGKFPALYRTFVLMSRGNVPSGQYDQTPRRSRLQIAQWEARFPKAEVQDVV